MGKPVLHGSVNIRIDARAMTAVGEFSLSKDGEDITSASIAAQLEAEGVYTGYSQHSIDEKLSRLPDPLPETVEIILAEGEKPVSPKPESANFNDFPVPEQLKEHTEQVLKAAKPPIIFVERKEKVPVEKTVTKKGLFGSSKEKTVTSTQVIKTKDRVYVDPKVLGSGYIYAGDEAGKISPGEKGLEGIDLFGKAVPPKAPADPNFYLGDGLERRGNTLYATQDGVLRYGSNWAEVLAFVPHVWSISISPDKSTCLISFYPGEHETPIPTEDEILAIVKEAKYPVDYLIPGRDIKMVLERALAADRKVQNYPISTSRDADFNISVSEDQMKAYLQIHKGRGRGKPLSLKEVGAAIKAEKLVGLDYAKIKEDLLAFFVSRDLDLTGYLLCEGVPPEEGEDREIEYNVDFLSGKDFSAAIAQLQAEPEGLQQMESGEVFPADSIQEMAPVAHEQRVITLSPPEPGTPGKDVYGKNIPGLPGKPAMLVLHENLAEKGNVIIALEEGILDKGEIEGTTHLRVRPHKDAEVLVEISPDGMMAFMSIFDGLGSGKRISEDSVFAAINDAGVVRGIDQQVVAELIEYVRNGEEVQNEVFARGKAPTPEGDVKIEYAVALASGKGVRLRQDGTADFRNQDNITRVNEGDLIATMLPPTVSAEDGYEVSGKVLPAQKAQGNQLTIHESIRQEPRQDGTIRLYSTIEGEFTNSGGVLAVRSTHTVKGDVCMSTGNIRFPGTVQVTGNVLAGFYVMAEGDVLIGGAVEASLISGNGTIKIAQGVKGAKKAVIRSKQEIQTMFAEQASLLAVADIKVKNSLMHCRTKSNGTIMLPQDKSTILGGKTYARHGIVTTNLGSPRGIHTLVAFGQDYLIGDRIEMEEKEIEKIKKTIAKIDIAMQQPENRNSEAALEQLRKKKVMALKAMEKLGLRLFSLRERFEEHFESSLVVRGKVFPGVTIESHGRTLEIQQERKNVTFRFDQQSGRIIEESNAKE